MIDDVGRYDSRTCVSRKMPEAIEFVQPLYNQRKKRPKLNTTLIFKYSSAPNQLFSFVMSKFHAYHCHNRIENIKVLFIVERVGWKVTFNFSLNS